MIFEIILLVLLISLIVINLYVTLKVIIASPEYSIQQRIYKILVVWLIPFIGALIVKIFRIADRQESPAFEELERERDLIDLNEKIGW